MTKNRIITVQDIPITVAGADREEYICITDMAAARDGDSRAADVVKNWLRNRLTLEFLGRQAGSLGYSIAEMRAYHVPVGTKEIFKNKTAMPD